MNPVQSPIHRDSLADVLERILDKGLVIAGDVSISLVGIELLTIRLRLLVATVDKAKELGINWWETDPYLHAAPPTGASASLPPPPMPQPAVPPRVLGPGGPAGDDAGLAERIARLEAALAASAKGGDA